MIIFTEWEHSVLHFYSNSAPEGCHPCHHGGLQPCFPLPLPSPSLFLCLFLLCLSVGLPPVCPLCLCLSFPPSFSLCHPLSPLLLSPAFFTLSLKDTPKGTKPVEDHHSRLISFLFPRGKNLYLCYSLRVSSSL